jgi:hypothetical protein
MDHPGTPIPDSQYQGSRRTLAAAQFNELTMAKIKPFQNAGGYTTFENAILDYIMPDCKPNTWKVVCATLRKTVGWEDKKSPTGRKESDTISLSQFMDLTGIKNRTTLSDAVQDALDNGYLVRFPEGQSFRYAINRQYELDTGTESVLVRKSYQKESRNRTSTSTESVHTKEKKERLKEIKDSPGADAPEQPKPPKPKSDYILAMEHLESVFADARGCPLPDWEGDPKAAQKRWRTPLKKIYNACEKNLDQASKIVRNVTARMRNDKLTFTCPDQILETALSEIIDTKSNGNGKGAIPPGIIGNPDETIEETQERLYHAMQKPIPWED